MQILSYKSFLVRQPFVKQEFPHLGSSSNEDEGFPWNASNVCAWFFYIL